MSSNNRPISSATVVLQGSQDSAESKKLSSLELKRMLKANSEKPKILTSMFGEGSQRLRGGNKSMKEQSNQDYNGYMLNLAKNEEKEYNPFTQAKLRVLLKKSSNGSDKAENSLATSNHSNHSIHYR